jgi:hypothetical protein
MSFDTIVGYLTVAASTALGGFIVACGIDILAGVVLAVRQGKFDWNKLPSFLGEQFATREFLGVVSLGVAAGTTALGSTLIHGGLTQEALQGVAQIALAAMTAGAAAMAGSVLKDAYNKVAELFGGPVAPPAPPPAPVPVTLVTPAGAPAPLPPVLAPVNPQVPPTGV